MNDQLVIQWIKFVKSGYKLSRFTTELYEFISTKSGFIAHYDRIRFHKARFSDIGGLDLTMLQMIENNELNQLIIKTVQNDLVKARLSVARIEYSSLIAKSGVLLDYARNIKSQYENF